jgi:hypothetical protein
MSDNSSSLDEDEIRDRMRKARDASLPGVIASDVTPRAIRWLWPGYLPLGLLCSIEGDPGEGKSLVTVDVGARMTSQVQLPDGASAKFGKAIIIAGEDDAALTLRPRLEAAGANLEHVRLWTKDLPVLPRDLPKLRRVIEADKARLVVLDPIDSFLGDKIDPNSNPSVRRVLGPLALIASELNCTIWIVRHLNKDVKIAKAIYRGAGSIGIAGQARVVFLAAPTRDNPDVRAFARVKGNLSKTPPTLGYRIVEATIAAPDGSRIKTQKIEWSGPVNASADDLLKEPEPARHGPKPDKLEAAKDFLRAALADGLEHESEKIFEEAKQHRISRSRLWDAASRLHVKRRKLGFHGPWLWSLPEPPENSNSSADTNTNLNGEKDFTEDSESQENSDSSRTNSEDSEFRENNSDSSTNPFSPNDFINSVDPENPEDSEFPDPLEDLE